MLDKLNFLLIIKTIYTNLKRWIRKGSYIKNESKSDSFFQWPVPRGNGIRKLIIVMLLSYWEKNTAFEMISEYMYK